jgi:2-polyprenyl-3-methyl-5-hydroxy-6-metoxy-1,4-benzoquinol methylase
MRRRKLVFLALVLCLAATGAAAAADQETWNRFLSWYKTYSGPPFPQDVLKAYTGDLAAAGRSEAEVREALAVVRRIAAALPPEMATIFFKQIFTSHQEVFTPEPTAFLVRMVRGLKPGKALDVAMGQGRNAVFLAKEGWDVTGYDLSEDGLAAARENAARAGVRVNAIHSTHQEFDFGQARWDLIVMAYAWVNMEDKAFLQRVKDSLKPGGRIVLEQLNSGGTGKGPANALLQSFAGLRVIHYEDTVDTADWGRNSARLGRIAAEKE